ncbi:MULTISPECIES: MerR family transcriptional regulator [Oceanobacillus]|uniref:MerR family transcriptional regulator n=1 Tax=Oceanobacillus aidingensis TaxID=645964 RepID=A0ABV9K0K4_9BACI|nr:MerR family transcriptional regulator [Oceanobacillus oncorhynchi]MDM8101246.1 MerR family transcriptional regulator [Oceanobacillus oncorhynchi]
MEKERKFSIGEISKLTGVTVRTLQYYDNIQLVPLQKSETSRRRYYTESDLTRLQQVLFYKSLGLKIKDITKLLEETTTAEQLRHVLEKQREIFYYKLHDIKSNIAMIEASLAGIEKNDSLPLGNLVQLIISLNKDTVYQYKDVSFDKKSEDTFMEHYQNEEAILEVYWDWKALILEAVAHILNAIHPESEQGQDFAKRWIEMVVSISGGSQELLDVYKDSYKNREQWPKEDRQLIDFTNAFIDKAVDHYLSSGKSDDWRNKND